MGAGRFVNVQDLFERHWTLTISLAKTSKLSGLSPRRQNREPMTLVVDSVRSPVEPRRR